MIKNKRKTYTIIEALRMMKKGKLMTWNINHMHQTGDYYSYEFGRFKEHNADSSIYSENVNFTNWILERPKKSWVVVTNKDLINLYGQYNPKEMMKGGKKKNDI